MNKGIFISFEGTEGAGKSTLINHLERALNESGLDTVKTREPGGAHIAEQIRTLILNHPMHPWTELFLYEASRAEHLESVIKPALEAKKIILCDRYADSSLAYQGYARGLNWNLIKKANAIATQGIYPDFSVFLDIDPKKGLNRANNPNRFENEGLAFQTKVRKGFLKAINESPKRWLKIKIKGQSPEVLATLVLKELKKRFKTEFKNLKIKK